MSNNKKSIFDREYTIRILLISLVCISVVVLTWTYRFKTDEILSIDENNSLLFAQNFEKLQDISQYGEFKDTNLSSFAQRKIVLTTVDRTKYPFDLGAFKALPLVPGDFGQQKFLFDGGRFYILKSLTKDYFLQPEFYDDWQDLGLEYFGSGGAGCKAGFFGTPSSQRIYTKQGADIQTFIILRSSFCDSKQQPLALGAAYPSGGKTDDGVQFIQNPDFVRSHIALRMYPSDVVLGKAYPYFDSDWAQKITVVVSVSKDTPKGLYVASIVPGSYFPRVVFDNLNLDAYKSKDSIANFIIGVD